MFSMAMLSNSIKRKTKKNGGNVIECLYGLVRCKLEINILYSKSIFKLLHFLRWFCINMDYDAYSALLTHLGANKNIINFKQRIVTSYKHIPSKYPRQCIPWKISMREVQYNKTIPYMNTLPARCPNNTEHSLCLTWWLLGGLGFVFWNCGISSWQDLWIAYFSKNPTTSRAGKCWS